MLLAYIFAEIRAPLASLFRKALVSSRLLEYETVNRMHAHRSDAATLRDGLRLLSGIKLIELGDEVLARALLPWPVSIKTSDSLHLATIDFLLRQGQSIELASYDKGMLKGAKAMGVPITSL